MPCCTRASWVLVACILLAAAYGSSASMDHQHLKKLVADHGFGVEVAAGGSAAHMDFVTKGGDVDEKAQRLSKAKKYAEAAKLYQESIDVRVRIFGHDSRETGLAYSQAADNLLEWGKLDEAEVMSRTALKIRQAVGDRDAVYTLEQLEDIEKARKRKARKHKARKARKKARKAAGTPPDARDPANAAAPKSTQHTEF
mmetsp:Transcript_18027/g.30817  ORF Transcript_18027/g.30817 Transcript_18027/m.30817 type:complete len:198 (+) Transcript_18027:40-633(+)